jgi:starch phosphorylase
MANRNGTAQGAGASCRQKNSEEKLSVKILGQIEVRPVLAPAIARLEELAYNLWWSWNPVAGALYRRIDSDLWEQSNHNPVKFLHDVSQRKLDRAAADPAYLADYERVTASFDAYMHAPAESTWYGRTYPGVDPQLIAYFSAEFGLHESLPIYSGGLGILAGDHCKTASDLGLPFVGVGFLYPQGYFQQHIDANGRQEAIYEKLDFSLVPALPAMGPDGRQALVSVELPGRTVYAVVWRIQVGRIPIYLMDTDVEQNAPGDRELSARLYGGDQQIRISQEIVLGIGGVRALRALGLRPSVWHLNEGHAAFLQFERIRELVQAERLSFPAALWMAKANAVFTTHTPVPAGNDSFPFELMDRFFGGYWGQLGLDRESFLDLGRSAHPWGPQFSMTVLALRTNGKANGVSRLHGEVSRRMWQGVWPGVPEPEVPIGHVTNGVHTETWLHAGLAELLDVHLDPGWRDRMDDPQVWQAVERIPDQALWQQHNNAKQEMLALVRERRVRQLLRQGAAPAEISAAECLLDPQALTIGFARRFATYKRATLIFRDPERIKRILNDPQRPVQIIFAGKAHPADEPGKAFIQAICELSRQPGFAGRLVFVEDYDANIARHLVAGVDVWLNNPRRPLEASGTSGQKAGLNGVPSFSALDGWWCEGYNGQNGWTIGAEREFPSESVQDEADALSLYATLENCIIPLYYNRDAAGLPSGWLATMRSSIASIAPGFGTHRMLKEYVGGYYVPSDTLGRRVAADGFAEAKALAEWEARVRSGWSSSELTASGPQSVGIRVGDAVTLQAVLKPGLLSVDDLAVEAVYGQETAGSLSTASPVPMAPAEEGDGGYRYGVTFAFPESGAIAYGVRARPDHPHLPNPFALYLVKWA